MLMSLSVVSLLRKIRGKRYWKALPTAGMVDEIFEVVVATISSKKE